MQITDKNSGKGAKVDDDFRLNVLAIARPEMTTVSQEKGKAYICYSRRNFLAANTNENVLYFEYTGSGKCIITKILKSSNSTNCKVEVYKKPVYISGGTAVVPLNLNFSSGNIANVRAFHGGTDMVMTIDALKEMYDSRISIDTIPLETEGIELRKGDAIGIIGSVATIGEVVRSSIFFYEVD